MTLQKFQCLLAVMETRHLSAHAYFCLFYSEMLLETTVCVTADQTETLLCFCRVLRWSLGSSDPLRNQAGLPGQGPQWRPGRTTDMEEEKLNQRKKLDAFYTHRCLFLKIVPVDCLHAHILGPQVHCGHRRSRSSLARCILLEPAWRCSSSGQQSSELHSVHKKKKTGRNGFNWRKNGPLQN